MRKNVCSLNALITMLLICICSLTPVQQVIAAGRGMRANVQVATGTGGMVVSETLDASKIGAAILAKGGNAVDATVAVAFALAVTWPEAGNIAGGGFMMIAQPDQANVQFIDYREKAPMAATADMFVKNPSRFSWQQVGVPGTVAGLSLAHQKWGKLTWEQCLMPAAELAKKGFEVDAYLALSLNHVLTRDNVQNDVKFAELKRVYSKPDGSAWESGDILVLPDIAKTITTLAKQGPDVFYKGSLANAIVAAMKEGGGLMTAKDLADYQAMWRPSVHVTFHGYDVYGPALPSAGGVTLAMMLNEIEALPLNQYSRYDAPAVHLIAEVQRRAYHQRALYLGDSDFVKIPEFLTTKAWGKQMAMTIEPMQATPSDSLEPAIKLADESPDTTHFSIVDAQGMAVSNTYTLEKSWGTRLIVPGTGMILNNEMGDFNPIPGHTDRKGKIGTKANLIEPGKRMLSSQTPIIIKHNGKVTHVIGSPGGRTITNTVLNVVLNRLVFGMPLSQAVQVPRQHHQWFPDRIAFENVDDPTYASLINQLKQMGHALTGASTQGQGSAHCIEIDPQTGERIGVADWRRGGAAVGQN
jgi:gamma-glutamyltranspeptidase/glutathione hydrolase